MPAHVGSFTVRADGLSDKKATQYESTLVGMLRSFEAFRAGQALMRGFRFYNRPVLVYPYDGKKGKCNAHGGGDHGGLFPSRISITPQMFNGASSCFPADAASASPHEVLFHELVHTLRSAAGKWGTWSAIAEEAAAITVANVFSSEMNHNLRDPWAPKSVAAVRVDPVAFMHVNTELMTNFYRQMPEFFRWVAEVNVPWNPIRLYYLTLTGVPRLNSAP